MTAQRHTCKQAATCRRALQIHVSRTSAHLVGTQHTQVPLNEPAATHQHNPSPKAVTPTRTNAEQHPTQPSTKPSFP